jgi:Collagen triple helix repeat (20 copies)
LDSARIEQTNWAKILGELLADHEHSCKMAMAQLVGETISKAMAPFAARLAELESRLPAEKGDTGEQGPQGEAGPRGETGAEGQQGRDGPAGPPGSVGPQGPPGERGETGAEGPRGSEGLPGPQGAVGAPGPQGPPGPSGERGSDGRDAADVALIRYFVAEQIDVAVAERFEKWIMSSADGGRTWKASFGGHTHEIKTAFILDAGVWTAERTYVAGDAVTRDGSLWIAQRETSEKPGKSDHWRLAVKRGNDGRDYRPENPPSNGPVRFK